MAAIPVQRLNHAVLFVRNAGRAAAFYQEVFGMDVVGEIPGRMVFLRAAGNTNHHDLGLMSIGENAPGPQPGTVGLYHLAWEVPTIEALAEARLKLAERGSLVGESDHGVSKSLYARDPDGNEFEIMWTVPEADWPPGDAAYVRRLDLDRDLARYGGQ